MCEAEQRASVFTADLRVHAARPTPYGLASRVRITHTRKRCIHLYIISDIQ